MHILGNFEGCKNYQRHCLTNGNEEVFSFTFRGSSCQGDFFGGAKKLHDLNHNFAVSNVVVEIFR